MNGALSASAALAAFLAFICTVDAAQFNKNHVILEDSFSFRKGSHAIVAVLEIGNDDEET